MSIHERMIASATARESTSYLPCSTLLRSAGSTPYLPSPTSVFAPIIGTRVLGRR